MYNGYSVKENITPETGCKQGSIMGRRDGIVTRGVLYDMPQMKGVEWIEPGTPITRADLEAWEKRAGVRVGPGDVIVLYVGRWKRRAAKGPWSGQVAGYYADTIPFFKERDISFAAHDMNIDWSPRPGLGRRAGHSRQSRSTTRCSAGSAPASSRTSISRISPKPRAS